MADSLSDFSSALAMLNCKGLPSAVSKLDQWAILGGQYTVDTECWGIVYVNPFWIEPVAAGYRVRISGPPDSQNEAVFPTCFEAAEFVISRLKN